MVVSSMRGLIHPESLSIPQNEEREREREAVCRPVKEGVCMSFRVCLCVFLCFVVVSSALSAQGAAMTPVLHHSYVDHARPQDALIWSSGGVNSLFPVTKRIFSHTVSLHNFQSNVKHKNTDLQCFRLQET